MDIHEIQRQTERIEYNAGGIDWIEKFVLEPESHPLSHTPKYSTAQWIAEAKVIVPGMANTQHGSAAAASLLTYAMREFMPKIIERALEIGRAANEEAKRVIRDEVAK